jgi:hypothetical protein
MTALRYFLIKMHELFGSHEFKLVRKRGGYVARCSCGSSIGRKRAA